MMMSRLTDTYITVIYIHMLKKKKPLKNFKLRVNLGANFLGRVENYRLSYVS